MSVPIQIERLETAKTDIKAAIQGKGVTVPNGTKIDGMAGLLNNAAYVVNVSADTVTADTLAEGVTAHDAAGNAITGTMVAGGDIAPFTQIITGTITPASDIYEFAVPEEITDTVVAFSIGYIGTNVFPVSGNYVVSGAYSLFTITTNNIVQAGKGAVLSPSTYVQGVPDIGDGKVYFNRTQRLRAGCEYAYVFCTREDYSLAPPSQTGSD